jgi:Zn-dependent peptidase ImmA (M78 family)/transcriptional regulator with XRE-family HTH domain
MIGQRMRQARLMKGLSLQEAVDRLTAAGSPLTKAGLSKYELGGSTPGASLLLRLARVLGVRSEYFLEEPAAKTVWIAFRGRAKMSEKARDRVKAQAENAVEARVWLQEKLYPDSATCLLSPTTVQTVTDAEKVAAKVRQSWGLQCRPVESLTKTIEDQGGIVHTFSAKDTDFDGLCGRVNDCYPIVVVNSDMPDDRRRFSMAHELGHLMMNCEALPPKEEEKLANRFAGAFLVPPDAARQELGDRRRKLDIEELKLLKTKHGLSMLGWVHRAYDLGIIDKGHFTSLYKIFVSRGWRQTEPMAYVGQETPMRLKQMTLRAFAEGIITPERAAVLCPGCLPADENGVLPPGAVRMTAVEVMRLPPEERARVLAEAALQAEQEYQSNAALTDFNAFRKEGPDDDPS